MRKTAPVVMISLLVSIAGCPPAGDPNDNTSAITIDTTVLTIAGTTTAGYSGDGGAASAAQLNDPAGVTIAPDGSVIVADFGNHVIRSIDLDTGIITTVAGTGEPTGEGALFHPTAVAYDSEGDMFVASWADDTIYRYHGANEGNSRLAHSLPGGSRERYAGNGESACDDNDPGVPAVEATICQPRSLAFLGDGTLIFAEQGCHRVRRVTADGDLMTYAGTGESGYDGDGGPATDALFTAIRGEEAEPNFGLSLSPEDPPDELYVADTGNNVIREIGLFTGTVETAAGTGASGFADGAPSQAAFAQPSAAFSSSDHAVWIVDTNSHAIRRLDPLGTAVETIIGTGTAGFNGDGLPPGDTQLNKPTGIYVTDDNVVFVVDAGNHRICAFRYQSGG